MGHMVFYPKNGWHSMKNNMLKYKKISNFRLITVNGEHIFFSIKKFWFFFCKLHPSIYGKQNLLIASEASEI